MKTIRRDGDVLYLALPYPPSVNHYYQPFLKRIGQRVVAAIRLGNRARQYRRGVTGLLRGRTGRVFTEQLAMRQVRHDPPSQPGDIDNFNKGLLDGITHARVWTDDKLVRRLVIDYGEPVEGGMIEVWIEPLARGVI